MALMMTRIEGDAFHRLYAYTSYDRLNGISERVLGTPEVSKVSTFAHLHLGARV